MKKYIVYRITNTINRKIYIGKHQTNNINDGYMGSGKRLLVAKEKYGIENFKKEILYTFDTEEEMNSKEAELVTEEFCLRNDTYNMIPGGYSTWETAKQFLIENHGVEYALQSEVFLQKRKETWNVKKVTEWVEKLSFTKEYVKVFTENDIDGALLKELDDDILREELQIKNRVFIYKHFKYL